MKTIVCYGDSNTWGFMPKRDMPLDWSVNRFAPDVRWTGVLQRELGAQFRVEEEGLSGRTTFVDDPQDPHRNGLKYIDTCMLTKMPVDMVVLMLGSNDLKGFLGLTPLLIARGVQSIAERIQKGGYGMRGAAPEILIVAPPALGKGIMNAWPGEEFEQQSIEKCAALPQQYAKVAAACGARFLDASAFITADDADCVHINEAGHAALGRRVAEIVRDIFK